MSARIPPRIRRGGIRCEFCGRVVPSEQALHSHQAALHSQALKEKAKQKIISTKSSKVQKPEQRKVLIKTYSNTAKKSPVEFIAKTPPSIQKIETAKTIKPKVETPKSKTGTESPKPKIEPSKPKIDTLRPKTEAPKPKTEAPKPKTEAPKPKTEAPKPNTEVPKSKTEAPKPKTVTPEPKIETPKPKTEATEIESDNTKPRVLKKIEMEAKNTPSKRRKTEYKCPKCEKVFPVLFVAQKHIQKYHSVNINNEKVASNSPQIIQPIILELCIYCNEKFSKPHNCPNQPDSSLLLYDCSGCQQRFKNNKLFDMHVTDVHGFQSETLFFSNDEEFSSWMGQMESQTECEYILMGKYNSKEIYRCNENTSNNTDDSVLLCPSTVILKKCPNGKQINFYLAHYGHKFKEYDLKDQYKSYTITDLIQQAGHTNGNTDDDLYLQFRTLMESIVLDAAKININTLTTLMSKASDMMTILKEYDEDDEEVETVNRSTISLKSSSSSLKDDDDDPKPTEVASRTRKRGLEENVISAKSSSSSLKDDDPKPTEVASRTRKRGLEENVVPPPKKIQKTTEDTKILVKSSTGKKSDTFSLADDKDSDKILKELDSANIKENKDKASIQSPTLSFNDTYKDFIMASTKTSGGTTGKKKNVVKTKIGQFKGPSPKKVVKRNSIGTAVVQDIKYEVIEQKNDCNILVLKM